jgi:hypothetical protein
VDAAKRSDDSDALKVRMGMTILVFTFLVDALWCHLHIHAVKVAAIVVDFKDLRMANVLIRNSM